MKEVKTPKKPLIFYYVIVLLALLVFNLIVSPILLNAKVQEVDYGTFMKMIEEKTSAALRLTTRKSFLPTRTTKTSTKPVK